MARDCDLDCPAAEDLVGGALADQFQPGPSGLGCLADLPKQFVSVHGNVV